VFILVLPSLYSLGFISQQDINRIGIVLNFIAGFMVAPELLGPNNVQKAEDLIEKILLRAQGIPSKIKIVTSDIITVEDLELSDILIVIAYISVTSLLLLVAVRNLLPALEQESRGFSTRDWIVILIITTGNVVVYQVIVGGSKVATWLLKHLAGDDRVRAFLVRSGIFVFIIGNLLQLVATYQPDDLGIRGLIHTILGIFS
jgi:hypothetical protein